MIKIEVPSTGSGGGNPFDQDLNTSDSPTFAGLTVGNNTNVSGLRKHLRLTIVNPSGVYTTSTTLCLVPALDAAITITQLDVTLDSATNQVAGDLKYANAYIGLANAVVINDFDTTSGVRSDNTITSGSVAAGHCIYLSFDTPPNAAIKVMTVDLSYDYD